jgi:putative ABC transport system substrate-binding protein
MRRREFITLLGGGAAAGPLTALAQQRPTMPVIGYLNGASAAQFPQLLAGFHKGLSETGYSEGRNVASNTATRTVNMIGCPHWPPTSLAAEYL